MLANAATASSSENPIAAIRATNDDAANDDAAACSCAAFSFACAAFCFAAAAAPAAPAAPATFDAVIGGLSVGTPGTPALMFKAHEKWGKIKWSNLFTTAINLGENGFPVSKKLASSIERDSERLKKSSQTSKYFLPDGNNLKYKQIVTNRAYAETLKKISTDGIEDFYKGEIADDIVNTVQNYSENPGYLEKSDLENYNVIERDPVCISYREHNVCGMGPPSSGGVAVAQILKILEEFNLKSLGYEDPKSWQVIGDASRLAFADRDRYLADSDFVDVPIKGLLDHEYLKKIQRVNGDSDISISSVCSRASEDPCEKILLPFFPLEHE